MKLELDALLPEVQLLCCRAADAIMEIYAERFDVEAKDDNSPLTAADMAAHHVLVDGLRALTPEIPVLSEESASIPFSERASWTRYWLVDPLDGTREFVKRNGEFTVNVALIDDHQTILGVIQQPVNGYLAWAARGHGAWSQQLGGAERRLAVSKPAQSPPKLAASRSHGNPLIEGYLQRLGEHSLVHLGSSLKFCRVAEGELDLYLRFGPTSEWDTGAAQCIVEEAGGHVTDLLGRPLRYNTRDSLLNPEFMAFGDAERNWRQYLDMTDGKH